MTARLGGAGPRAPARAPEGRRQPSRRRPRPRRPRHRRRPPAAVSHSLRGSPAPAAARALQPGRAPQPSSPRSPPRRSSARGVPASPIFEVALQDDSGTARAVWFNQRFLRDVFHRGQLVALFGKVEQTGSGLQLTSPQFEVLADDVEPDRRGRSRLKPRSRRAARRVARPARRFAEPRPARADLRAHRHADAAHAAHAWSIEALATLPAELADPLPAAFGEGWSCRRAATRCARRTSRTPSVDLAALERVSQPGAGAAHLRGVLPVPARRAAARSASLARAQKPHVRWSTTAFASSARAVLPFKLTPGQQQAIARDRRRHAAARSRCTACCRATSAPARRSWRCSRRSSRWRTGCRSRSWRRPRSWPSSTTATIARLLGAVAVPRRRC